MAQRLKHCAPSAARGERRSTGAMLLCGLLWLASPTVASAQLVTVGGGVLVTKRSTEPVAELHGETPPLVGARAYVTLSWTDESTKPTIISAVERPVVHLGSAFAGVGAGLLWLETNDYRPYPMLVSSTVVPLPVPRTSFVFIASTLPFEDFDWSLVFKIGVTVVFLR
ncbi:MAG: hypothetical protein OEO20_15440 [Gemmatimonadota bacterium]|nr:hypothetical protein [Gemmatimonadota bacterium]MDH3369674.1 hypothetical protein [Gemmatimonadota bacterium]MDH3479689.1 hypothetical protein [Gemmatimonadota bacterium]MDH5549817.1 hypothetical protein [Gemmatimonadota bacterium]